MAQHVGERPLRPPPAEQERMEDERAMPALAGQGVDFVDHRRPQPPSAAHGPQPDSGTEGGGLEARRQGPRAHGGVLFADQPPTQPSRAREVVPGIDEAPSKWQQRQAIVRAGTLAMRRGVAVAMRAQQRGTASVQPSTRRAEPGWWYADARERASGAHEQLLLPSLVERAPVLVPPSVACDLVPGGSYGPEHVGIELCV